MLHQKLLPTPKYNTSTQDIDSTQELEELMTKLYLQHAAVLARTYPSPSPSPTSSEDTPPPPPASPAIPAPDSPRAEIAMDIGPEVNRKRAPGLLSTKRDGGTPTKRGK